MSRKAVDARIPTLIRNGVQSKKRSIFVVVGDRAKDVIVHLHYIMSSMDVASGSSSSAGVTPRNKSVLWAYKKKLLDFTSHRKKREAKIKKEVKRGVREANTNDPFELFVTLHDIRYVYYKETDKILGNTYGMCILQDFEALTPNMLARTVETVEGGGLVVLLLKSMTSLRQLYTMTMDVHSRYRTEAHTDVVPRFNERFILSLGGCDACLVIDDELNVLPISQGKEVKPLPPPSDDDDDDEDGGGEGGSRSENTRKLAELKDSLSDTPPIGSLVPLARTLDQAQALLTFTDALAEKSLQGTVALTAARGRGKSAAMGVAVAAAVAHGYANIFITSPSPENLKTLFDFVFRGFDALGYLDHVDYTIIQSTNPDLANKPVVRVNIHRNHRQTIQYIRPQDAHVLGQAELLVIDEAAAIPLPLVRKLMGPYLVFMASTINGYEGTGRSLSLKLIKQLREQSRGGSRPASKDSKTAVADRSTGRAAKVQDPFDYQGGGLGGARTLREITLSEPIRYAQGDAVESWLNTVLCLDAKLPRAQGGSPAPSSCELLQVNRDTLFSFHAVSERFLQQMVALYVSSHYKNTPDDLQLMSDAPAHELFVLVPPISEDSSRLPEPLCVIQVALEGRISRESVLNALSRGTRPAGDLIPWLVSQQFQDDGFASLSGARIVRIATNPNYVRSGYGARALELLCDHYGGKFTNLSEADLDILENHGASATMKRVTDAELAQTSLLEDDNVKVRDIQSMPPLFSRLSESRPPALDYVGVSYGLTGELLKFWKRASFAPVYLRQTANELTGEHTCVMLRPLESSATSGDASWLGAFSRDFHRRYLSLLSFQFRDFSSVFALSISEAARIGAARFADQDDAAHGGAPPALTKAELDALLTPFDLKRLESYANNMLDYHLILDLVPTVAHLYFTGRLGAPKLPGVAAAAANGEGRNTKAGVELTGVMQGILLGIGLQRKDMDTVSADLTLPVSQLMAMFIKILRKVTSHFATIVAAAVEAEMPRAARGPLGVSRADASGVHDDEVVDDKFKPLSLSIADELNAKAGKKSLGVAEEEEEDVASDDEDEEKVRRRKQRELINALPLDQYEVEEGDVPGWEEAERQVAAAMQDGGGTKKGSSTTVSIKSSKAPSSKRKPGDTTVAEVYDEAFGEKKKKKRRH
ncbi:N-acetyltransferase 10 [Sporothrix brasiliensis 5110]|uniref:RNA cytidine acetyltransferase n=1 Tax=Sporothrix brasiliensis 5110 TaxID=1398154 RepID=A0A0C2EPQ6_9PEZI|nr:N-acetyltransferase 10 [Sporothrix brasiliensis 5110]KIH88244.1 N-acetyltransferase 10 [Sporothrix brasiliensis 5110]